MYSYLALGDSYTIGELVEPKNNFPHQLVQLLNEQQVTCAEPVIIATTGWTTDELLAAITEQNILDKFSFVTLLIGVNNQYRGRSVANFTEEFTTLLNIAIEYAAGQSQKVFVLSIPDWGGTPFAAEKDASVISTEIDAYNNTCAQIAKEKNCHYLYITDSTRENVMSAGFLASDNLHPSEKEYAVWASRLLPLVQKALQK